jgi:DNA-binding transcriptional MerR regulator
VVDLEHGCPVDLLKNLWEAVEVELCQRPLLPWSPPLPEAASLPPAVPVPAVLETPDAPPALPAAETPAGSGADVARIAVGRSAWRSMRRARALRDEGYTWAVVALQVGVPPRTLRYWFAHEGFPERKRRTGDRSGLAPYRTYLRQRWEAGEHSATHLWHELRAQEQSQLLQVQQAEPLLATPATHTEGHVNRLKLLKRQMYGRAKLGLLRQRILYAA